MNRTEDVISPPPRASESDEPRAGEIGRVRAWLRERQLVIGAFLGSRLVVLLTTYIAAWRDPGQESAWDPIVRYLTSWDSGHYLAIARVGYSASEVLERGTRIADRLVFFPLWPMLERAANWVLPLGLIGSSILLVHVLTFAAALRFRHLLVRETGSPRLADRASTYLLIFPSAFVLSMPYADPLFLLLSVLFFDFIRGRRWFLAATIGVLASLCRAQGAILALPAFIEFVLHLREKWKAGEAPGASGILAPLPAIAGPALGFAGWLAYVQVRFGDFMLAIEPLWQEHWKDRPSFFLTEALAKLNDASLDQLPQSFFHATIVIGAFLLALLSLRLLPLTYSMYFLVALAISTSSVNFVSTDRYVLGIFPIFWVMALVGNQKWLDSAYRSISPALMGAIGLMAWLKNWIP